MAKIDLNDVSLTFTVRQQRRTSLKEYLIRGLFRESVNPKVAVHALSGVNLSVREGDRLGIIGHNGAGKSTMLKLLAGIYPPTVGVRDVEGRICSLFDISLGFEPEANGWDNITYRAYLQGETPRTLKSKIDGIAAFSELGKFLDLPVRYYSAGMMVRLAFAIATAANPEILLIDEVLSVGDMAFQRKARTRMEEMMATARLMVVVSHDLASLLTITNRVVWMEQGSVRMEGDPLEVIRAYQADALAKYGAPPVGAGTKSEEPARAAA
jgi:lipopolysaccharide transport system ATP-binding protein